MEESQNKEVKEHRANALLENFKQSEALVYNTDIPIATYLQALIPSLNNYASSEFQMTGPDQPTLSNLLLHQSIQPIFAPVTSLIPPATLLVPYPLVVPLPVPLPVPIPIHSNVFIKTPRTGSTIDRSVQTLSTICCCTSNIFPHTPSVSQDEVLDLSCKATQTNQEHLLSASPNLALDLSVVNSNNRSQRHWRDDMNGQNTQYEWTIHESSGNKIVRSKDYNGRTVHSTQTVRDIVSPTETVPGPFCDQRRGFSRDYMISSMKPDRRLTDRQISNNRTEHFKRGGSQNMYGNSPPCKKPHLTGK